jgi:hypothetical protein
MSDDQDRICQNNNQNINPGTTHNKSVFFSSLFRAKLASQEKAPGTRGLLVQQEFSEPACMLIFPDVTPVFPYVFAVVPRVFAIMTHIAPVVAKIAVVRLQIALVFPDVSPFAGRSGLVPFLHFFAKPTAVFSQILLVMPDVPAVMPQILAVPMNVFAVFVKVSAIFTQVLTVMILVRRAAIAVLCVRGRCQTQHRQRQKICQMSSHG